MFKKILFLSFIAACLGWSPVKGQSFEIVEADSIVYGNASNTVDISGHIKLKNVSRVNVDVMVKRMDSKGYNALTDSNAICWGICFPPSTSQTPFSSVMIPDSVYNDFSGHVYPDLDGVVQSGPITYVFFNENNPMDSIAHTIYYAVSANFSLEESQLEYVKVYPNPASQVLSFSAGTLGKGGDILKIFDVTGSLKKSMPLGTGGRKQTLTISEWPRGLYFYAVERAGKTLSTKKLLVQ